MAMINQHISTQDWLQLSREVRNKLIEIFKIPRSGVGHIDFGPNGPVQSSDGYTYEDLKAITVEKMQEYLKSKETDFTKLLEKVIEVVSKPTRCKHSKDLCPTVCRYPDDANGLKPAQKTQEQVLESWTSKLKDIRVEAETRGLLTEFIKLLRAEIKVKR